MSENWTPGPWRVSGSEVVIPDGPFRTHAYCGSKANAALVAVAPDLYAALEQMMRAFSPHPREDTEGWREEHEAYEGAIAALAKARGEA
jgi:hypothetical protein